MKDTCVAGFKAVPTRPLVARLRDVKPPICKEAADEIERLQRQVAELKNCLSGISRQAAFDARRELYLRARFAPGQYLCRCAGCKQQFQGDKRAGLCFECATAVIAEAHTVE